MFNRLVRKLFKDESGFIMAMALMIMAAALFMVLPGLSAAGSVLLINNNMETNTRAFYAADAGVSDLIWRYSPGHIAPTVDYDLPYQVNGMSVHLSLKHTTPITNGDDYFWESSSISGAVTKARVIVKVELTGDQGNNIFDQAVVALNGNITMSGGCKVISDDIFIVDDCDSSWTRIAASSHLSPSTDSGIKETGLYYDTSKSAKFALQDAAVAENLAYRNTSSTENISGYSYLSAWVTSTVTLASGDMQLILATNTALGGTTEYINIPAVSANTGTRILLQMAHPTYFGALKSIGIKQAVDKGALTLYIDEVTATNNLSKNGDIYANGNVSLQPSAIVNGNASASGTVSVNTGGGAKVWGVQDPAAPPYVPQTIDYQSYIDLATGPGSTHYSTWPSGWTYGTHNIGPANFDGNISIGGSNTIILTGDVYVRGKLTITAGALVQGPYTLIASSVEVSGGSGVELAKGNIPLFIAMTGNFDILNSAQISGVVYAPNGTATISGGTGPNGYNLYGAVVAQSVVMAGSTQVKYLSGIRMMPWPTGWGLGPGPGQGGSGGGTSAVTAYDYE
jgi:hypothetical protein